MSNQEKLIRALIVDDEQPARDELAYLLSRFSDVAVAGEAVNYRQAIAMVTSQQPHLVFLDIHMPGVNGMETARELAELNLPPYIVFATAHDEYALAAFEVNAVDYLLKPFSAARVERCINKVRQMLNHDRAVDLGLIRKAIEAIGSPAVKQKLALEANGKAHVIDTSEIAYVSCYDGVVQIHTAKKAYQSNLTLQELHERLNKKIFFRCHRSYLVNIEKIREIIPWFNGTYNLTLEGIADAEIPVSRHQAAKLKQIFEL